MKKEKQIYTSFSSPLGEGILIEDAFKDYVLLTLNPKLPNPRSLKVEPLLPLKK